MYDVIIIGAGVVGAFVARNLSKYTLKVAVIERHNDVCMEATKANSAIVHSGYNGKKGALKTDMTIRANENFHVVCEELDVEFSRCGSLMIAIDKKGEKKVREKYERGLENGVKGICILSREEVLEREPNINPEVTMALYAPTTGIVNPWAFGIAAMENAVDHGVEVFLNQEVCGVDKMENGTYLIRTNDKTYTTRYVINCAGLQSDFVHTMVAKPTFRIAPRRGEYFVLDTNTHHIGHVIFQGRGEDSPKGVIVVPTVAGNILVGPSTEDVFGAYNTKTSREKLETIKEVSENSVRNLPFDKVIRQFAGIRPRPQLCIENPETGEVEYFEDDVKDFILGEVDGAENFLNCAGIKSPGLTCADEIGKYITDCIAKKEVLQENPNYNKKRRPLARIKDATMEERQALVLQNPQYGHMICRCQQISEGEIVDAIHRSVGATTIDGVKRRVGTSLGRCQGGFCTSEVLRILSRELDVPPSEIMKDKNGTYVIRGELS